MEGDEVLKTSEGKVLRDSSLTIDGDRLTPRLVSAKFPGIQEMKEGRGRLLVVSILSCNPNIRVARDEAIHQIGRNSGLVMVFEDEPTSRAIAGHVHVKVEPAVRFRQRRARTTSLGWWRNTGRRAGCCTSIGAHADVTGITIQRVENAFVRQGVQCGELSIRPKGFVYEPAEFCAIRGRCVCQPSVLEDGAAAC